jgi:hypothetical protein
MMRGVSVAKVEHYDKIICKAWELYLNKEKDVNMRINNTNTAPNSCMKYEDWIAPF